MWRPEGSIPPQKHPWDMGGAMGPIFVMAPWGLIFVMGVNFVMVGLYALVLISGKQNATQRHASLLLHLSWRVLPPES